MILLFEGKNSKKKNIRFANKYMPSIILESEGYVAIERVKITICSFDRFLHIEIIF